MVSVVKNYLTYNHWDNYKIKFIPTHIDCNKYVLIFYFGLHFIKIWWNVVFSHYDIAHLHVAERGSFWRKTFLLKFLKRHHIKVILHHHGAEFEDFYNSCTKNQKDKIKNALTAADMNIVLSKRHINIIKSKAPNACVKVLYNAVFTYPYNPYSLKSKDILFLGRLGIRKGTLDLLDAIKIINDQLPSETKIYLCGDEGENLVKNKVKALGIQHRIAHIGWITGEKKNKIIKNVMLNVLPSYNEGLPMTILETMSMGIPNISTNIASIPEVIHDGENGYLIEPGDIKELGEKILFLIRNKEKRKSFSERAYREITDHFSLSHHICILKSIYKELTS